MLVPLPKLHEKEIIRLEPNEVAQLLDQVEAGTKLTDKQSAYHAKTKIRDEAFPKTTSMKIKRNYKKKNKEEK